MATMVSKNNIDGHDRNVYYMSQNSSIKYLQIYKCFSIQAYRANK